MSLENRSIFEVTNQSLAEWQKIAFKHFTDLYAEKSKKNLPVFALEHNFSRLHLEFISKQLLDDYVTHRVNKSYWLLWVIYATEIGYRYTGEEYWQSFEEKITNWDNHDREQIRSAFKEFIKRFNGIKPTGTWANHFSIIALPITHAILPIDLQFHFANLLYFTRYKFKNASVFNPKSVGSLLAAHSYFINSSRFKNFLQQEDLVGRIALSFLVDDSATNEFELLYPQTLKRIVANLEEQSIAKEWIEEAKREIKPKILGVTSAIRETETSESTRVNSFKKTSHTNPKLKLFQSEKNSCQVVVEIPRLTEMFDDPMLVSFLKNTRYQINGAKGNWLPAETLLYGSSKKKILHWPNDNNILKFEDSNATLDNLLTGFMLSKPPWLFKIGPDGIATEVLGKHLRPDKKYIALFPSETPGLSDIGTDVIIECENIIGKQLTLPKAISEQDAIKYKGFGFDILRTVRVWPAGLSARDWDGEGNSEWLTTDAPCFGIAHDFNVTQIQLQLNSFSLTLSPESTQQISFIHIDPLPAGKHVLKIKSISQSVLPSEGLIILNVREPVSWTPGVSSHNGMTIYLDPNNYNLDSFLKGETNLQLYGPESRVFAIQFDLIVENELLVPYKKQGLSFPFHSDILRAIRKDINGLQNISIARQAKLTITCDDIGSKEFLLTRPAKPLRWVRQVDHGIKFLRLIDETDNREKPQVLFFASARPDLGKDISDKNFLQKTEIKDVNGLFWARKEGYQDGTITTAIQTAHDFGSLSISPILQNSSGIPIFKQLRLIQMWYTSECFGLLARIHQNKIIEILIADLYTRISGLTWSKEEGKFINTLEFSAALDSMSSKISNRSMANVIRYRYSNMRQNEINVSREIQWFVGAAKRCNLNQNSSLVMAAINFASNPFQYIDDLENPGQSIIKAALDNDELMKAARFFVLCVSKVLDPYKDHSLLIPAGFKQ